jgi:gluconolactonase
MTRHSILRTTLLLLAVNLTALAASTNKTKVVFPTVGSLESLDPRFAQLVPLDAKIEKLAEGFIWSEGPVWVPSERCLLFSDIPNNVVNRWKEGEGVSPFLWPSGYTGKRPRGGEVGSNALLFDGNGRLVLCEHGDRRVARLESNGTKTTLAEFYLYRRLNSPNDAVYRSNGDLYFTDPPYGLEKRNEDPQKELLFNGVFRLPQNGQLELLTTAMTYPNGIAFSPDERTLYIANSDPAQPVWMAWDLKADGSITNARVFFDAKALAKDRKGLPDGMKIDNKGNLFGAGPGGILVLSPDGKHLGTIMTGEPTSNCAWGDDGSVLYMTCNMNLCRIKTKTKGKGF